MLGIYIVIAALGLIIFLMYFYIVVNRLEKDAGLKGPVKVSQPKITVEEILREELKNPPMGCMWNVTREIKPINWHNPELHDIKEMYYANIALINPLQVKLKFTVQVYTDATSSDRIKSFRDELSYHVKIVTDRYNRMIKASEMKDELDGGWDGVYN